MTSVESHGHVVLDGVGHAYRGAMALEEFSLSVRKGEFLTVLGPSGCGKTTLLRLIAGFERPQQGRIYVAGRDVTTVAPHKRPVNMVFQRPALFPHLDVFENVAFGLRLAGVPKAELRTRVGGALAQVRLKGFERRASQELSGGQMHRVALARALVKRPAVLLLDEPLGALDLKIRLEMEVELRRLHRETGATFLYVTHDQREALALGDRTAVLNIGRLEQVGTPGEIYDAPVSRFVASFVGDANVLPAIFRSGVTAMSWAIDEGVVCLGPTARARDGTKAWLVVRPEVVRLESRSLRTSGLRGFVRDSAFRGTGFSYRVDVPGLPTALRAEVPKGDEDPLPVGSEVAVSWPLDAVALISRDSPRQDNRATDVRG